jgi:hypothetical protein
MHPQGPEGGPDNTVGGSGGDYGHNAAPSGEGHVPAVKDDDPQDPPTEHPAGGKAASVDELLKQANEIGAAIRGLIKGASDIPDAQREFSDDDSATAALPEDNDNITIPDDMGSTTASKEGANPAAVIDDLRKAASVDADSFATVCLGVLGGYGPVKAAMDEMAEMVAAEEEAAAAEGGEEAVAEEEDAEDVLAQMAMADEGAPSEEDAVIEEILAAEGAPAEEELGPEEAALLMELLASEGMAGEDVAAYGKMSAAVETGRLNIAALPQVQQNYYSFCKKAAQNATSKLSALKASAKISSDLNSIYKREGK